MKFPIALILLLTLLSVIGCHHPENDISARYAYDTKKPFLMMMPGLRRVPSEIPINIHFKNVALDSGLNYKWEIKGTRPLNILQGIGTGCAFLDYDNDGNLDILLIGEKLALYHGDGKGHFSDVSSEMGLGGFHGQFLGCAVGDIDGDGFDDIYISGYHTALLLRNDGGKGFHDITKQAGLSPQPWGTSCTFGESVPGSGKLDLHVCNYVEFGPETQPQQCTEHNIITSCGPVAYKPLTGIFYRNDGHGNFTDQTSTLGLKGAYGKGLGVEFVPLETGKPLAIAIANDEMPGDLFIAGNSGAALKYSNVAQKVGSAFDRDGHTHGGMGLDFADFNNDGYLDYFVTTFENEARSLYRSTGKGFFTDVAMNSGFGLETSKYVAFGCHFFDFDNDGWLDLIVSNGHVQDNVSDIRPNESYRQPVQIFRNSGGTNPGFDDITTTIPDLQIPIVGRGLAIGDFDNDGKIDALVVDAEGKPLLIHNECENTGHWLGIKLIGTKSNRNGYGTRLTAIIGNKRYLQYCHADGSYLSSSDSRVHFGLGNANKVDKLIIQWPSGYVDKITNITADRYITLIENSNNKI